MDKKQDMTLQQQLEEQKAINAEMQKRIEESEEREKALLQYAEQQFLAYTGQIDAQRVAITQAKWHCEQMLRSHVFKLLHLWGRIKKQLIQGNMQEKKAFFAWLMHRNNNQQDARFQPLRSVFDTLARVEEIHYALPQLPLNADRIYQDMSEPRSYLKEMDIFSSQLMAYLQDRTRNYDALRYQPLSPAALQLKELLHTHPCKGIMVYPHTVNWEPLQTPQQLLCAFAREGWLCLFCEHPSVHHGVKKLEENLYMVCEEDVLQAVGNTEVTILLTWMGSLSFVDHIANKKIWYNVLDQLDIFALYDSLYEDLHYKMVESADWVSYVASPLLKCIPNREDAIYLPNGCHPEEMICKTQTIPADLKPILETGHKIIGYYGFLAEWMDYDMIRTVALARPECEFVFIGKAAVDTACIDTLPNVHLLGLKKYQELPAYASHFDMATIPFLVNDMMDCVSPIKFYEYCAYGVPVISSQMKEMNQYECNFVACVNGAQEYLEKLDRFLTPEVAEDARKNAPRIAEENSWRARAREMEHWFALPAKENAKAADRK